MKFSIRDLLWFTVVVALVLGWWVDGMRARHFYDQSLEEVVHELDDAGLSPLHTQRIGDRLRSRGWDVEIIHDRVPASSAHAPNPPNPDP